MATKKVKVTEEVEIVSFKPTIITAMVELVGSSEYSQSRYLDVAEFPKLDKEKGDDYDERIWREKGWWSKNQNGQEVMYIPGMQVKNCLENISKYLGDKIAGKGNSTYPKHFKAGIMVSKPFQLTGNLIIDGTTYPNRQILKDYVSKEVSFPTTKSGNRVKTRSPIVHNWRAVGEINILDQVITPKIFENYLIQAGWFTGLGRYRVGNGGSYGRFILGSISFRNGM